MITYDNPVTITMDKDKTATAYFEAEEVAMPQYVLTIAVSPTGSGYTYPAVGSYISEMGASVSVTAFPYSGYEFDHWEGYAPSYPLSTYQFEMPPNNLNLTAVFRVAGTRPAVGVRPGSVMTATATLSNPTTKPFDYSAKLFMGITAIVSSIKSLHLNASESKDISFPITMPEDFGTYPVYLAVSSGGVDLPLYRGTDDIIVAGPSDLLFEYQAVLDQAITMVEDGNYFMWLTIPGFGLQYAGAAVGQLKDLMVVEAISLGLISSGAEAYFDRAIMYFTDGTTIVPYWWQCPYCAERFRSPALLEAHKQAEHFEAINTKGYISAWNASWQCAEWPYDAICWITGLYIVWKNESPFAIQGHVALDGYTATSGQDTIVPAYGGASVYFPVERINPGTGRNFTATLTRKDGPVPGMVLDRQSQYVSVAPIQP